jgi:hypothetical protein
MEYLVLLVYVVSIVLLVVGWSMLLFVVAAAIRHLMGKED